MHLSYEQIQGLWGLLKNLIKNSFEVIKSYAKAMYNRQTRWVLKTVTDDEGIEVKYVFRLRRRMSYLT